MKLKKIVSLALAGILAVSMLAGCSNNGSNNNSSSSEAPAATGMAGKVIAALGADNVTFGTDNNLQKTLDAWVENSDKTASTLTSIANTDLTGLNPSLGSTSALPVIESTNTDTDTDDAKVQTSVFVTAKSGINEQLVAEQLAGEIADEAVSGETDSTIAGLPKFSKPDAKGKYQYNFKYTGAMAVATVKNSTTGETTYVVAYTITRTPTKVDIVK